MKNLKGGATQININKQGFLPLYDMLNSRGAKLELITDKSLFSFIFRLTVNEENSEYLKSDVSNTPACNPIEQFSKRKRFIPEAEPALVSNRIVNYILKIVVLNNQRVPYSYSTRNDKSTETPENFLQEANNQETLWINSIQGNRLPTCPAVANVWRFDNTNSLSFLNYLGRQFGCTLPTWLFPNKQSQSILFLQELLSQDENLEIGVLLMPEITESETLTHFYTYNNNYNTPVLGLNVNSQICNNVSLKALALLLRIFVENAVIHSDFRTDNILVYKCGEQFEAIAIDFGVIEHVQYMENYQIDAETANKYRQYWNYFTSQINHIKQLTNEQINEQINEPLTTKRKRTFDEEPSSRRSSEDVTPLVTRLFDSFKVNIIDSRIDRDWIDRYFTPNNYMTIFNYLKNYLTDFVYRPQIQPTYSIEPVIFPGSRSILRSCAISGGNKYNKSKRCNKTKQNKNKNKKTKIKRQK